MKRQFLCAVLVLGFLGRAAEGVLPLKVACAVKVVRASKVVAKWSAVGSRVVPGIPRTGPGVFGVSRRQLFPVPYHEQGVESPRQQRLSPHSTSNIPKAKCFCGQEPDAVHNLVVGALEFDGNNSEPDPDVVRLAEMLSENHLAFNHKLFACCPVRRLVEYIAHKAGSQHLCSLCLDWKKLAEDVVGSLRSLIGCYERKGPQEPGGFVDKQKKLVEILDFLLPAPQQGVEQP